MTYTLFRLAPGAYDIDLDGTIIGGVVKNEPPERGWRAELLNPYGSLPPPFTDVEHRFLTLEEARQWLGQPEVKDETRPLSA
jgi:hypothetical protein